MGYGTGAIMAVPGEDQRDWDFAKAARPADHRHGASGPTAGQDDAGLHRRRGEDQLGLPRRARRSRRPSGRRSTGWSRRGSARPRSTTGCATGASAGSATGARRSRCSTARRTAWCRSGRRTSRWCCPATCRSAARAARRWPRWPSFVNAHVPEVRRQGAARHRHHGHLRGVVLVLPPLLLARLRPGHVRAGRGGVLDAGRPVHRRHRARGAAPALRALLHQGAPRPRA